MVPSSACRPSTVRRARRYPDKIRLTVVFRAWLPVAMASLALVLAGCGTSKRPPLGSVEGTITLDGIPLPGAFVVFTPDGPGRSATAMTDTAGRYSLTFLRDLAGANVGAHTVRITTATGKRGSKELLPRQYHAKSELVATVEPGRNTVDFALKSR